MVLEEKEIKLYKAKNEGNCWKRKITSLCFIRQIQR